MKNMSNAVRGFTLIELMMTLSIAALLITFAVPSYNTFTKNSKLTKQVNLLAGSVSAARGEAAKRGSSVTLCQTTDPDPSDGSDPVCGGTAGTWSAGWIIFVDLDTDGEIDTSAPADTIVNVFQAEKGAIIKTTAGASLSFNPDGTTTSGTSLFAVCDDRGVSHGKQLDVSGTGRPSTGNATSCG